MEDVSWQQHFGEEDMQHLLAPAEPRPFRHEAANRNHSQQHQRYFQCSTEHLLHFSPFPFGCKKATHCWAFLYLKRSIANNKPQLKPFEICIGQVPSISSHFFSLDTLLVKAPNNMVKNKTFLDILHKKQDAGGCPCVLSAFAFWEDANPP
jgi:hypothetical protein